MIVPEAVTGSLKSRLPSDPRMIRKPSVAPFQRISQAPLPVRSCAATPEAEAVLSATVCSQSRLPSALRTISR